MKKVLILFFILCYSFILFAGAEITFDNLNHDYGKIKEDEGPYDHNFSFTNTGDEPFKLVKVKAGWGCTTPSWSTDEIKAGEKGFITVAYKSDNRPGKFNKTIKVNTSINSELTKLTIKGEVVPTPGKLRNKIGLLRSSLNRINFGYIFYQEKSSETIEIENSNDSEMTVYVENCPEYIKLKIEPEILAAGERGKIVVTFDSKIKDAYGTSKDFPQIKMKLNNRVYKGVINITAIVIEDFSKLTEQELINAPVIIFPKKSINIGEIEKKQKKNIEIEFENRGERELLIRNIEINNNSFIIYNFDKIVKA